MKRMKVCSKFLVISLIGLFAKGVANADLVVFSTNFDSGLPAEVSGPVSIESVQGFAGIGHVGNTFGSNFARNSSVPGQSTTLTLTDLPGHTHVSVDFLLGILESWDGGTFVSGAGPDIFNVSIDGNLLFSESFETSNVSPQSYIPPPGVELVHKVNLGNWGHGFPESGYDMGMDPLFQNIAHTSDTLTIEWFANGLGWQGGSDESWAIDNLSVTLQGTSVPEPGMAGILVIGMCALSWRRRRRR